jgi:hypothetical protein
LCGSQVALVQAWRSSVTWMCVPSLFMPGGSGSLPRARAPGLPRLSADSGTAVAEFSEEALIAGNRALIEQVIRFAQAHNQLGKNAERSQRFPQESYTALETYQ